MVYVQRASWFPNPEHVGDIRAVLLARVRTLQESGFRASLSQTVYGSQTPALHILISFADIAALEQYRRDQAEALVQLASNTVSLIRQPGAGALSELSVPNPNPSASDAYLLRIVTRPLPDKGAEAAALMSEWAKTRGAQGYRFSLARELAGPNAGTFINNVAFSRLEEWHELMTRGRSEEATQQYLRDLSALQAALPATELLQVLVPIQPA